MERALDIDGICCSYFISSLLAELIIKVNIHMEFNDRWRICNREAVGQCFMRPFS